MKKNKKGLYSLGGLQFKRPRGRLTINRIIDQMYDRNQEYIDEHLAHGTLGVKAAFKQSIIERLEQTRKSSGEWSNRDLSRAVRDLLHTESFITAEERGFNNIRRNIRENSELADLRDKLRIKRFSFREWNWNEYEERYEYYGVFRDEYGTVQVDNNGELVYALRWMKFNYGENSLAKNWIDFGIEYDF